jgi:putative FmdB family regulatory protein
MPEYTYHCDKCHSIKLITKSMVDAGQVEFCPVCSEELRRDFSTSYSSMTIRCDRNWEEVKWKGKKPEPPQDL